MNIEIAVQILDSLNLDWDVDCRVQKHHITGEIVSREYWSWIWKDIGLKTYMGNGETFLGALLDTLKEFLADPPSWFTQVDIARLEETLKL